MQELGNYLRGWKGIRRTYKLRCWSLLGKEANVISPGTVTYIDYRAQIQEYEDTRENHTRDLTRHVHAFIESNQSWQAELIRSIRQSNIEPHEDDEGQLFTRLHNGTMMDRRKICRDRLHDSLVFPEMRYRHDTIPLAHKRTFEWIFHGLVQTADQSDADPATVTAQWDSFTDWLSTDRDTTYWISGKPGSGKSSLMKYLYNDERTLACARTWSRDHPLISAGFFLSDSGTVMQMSFLGLLQSLLYQCVAAHREIIIPNIFPARWQNYMLYGRDLHPWSEHELKTAIKKLFAMSEFRFVIFLDGLDEFNQDLSELADFIIELNEVSPQNLKLCVASRPFLQFEEPFQRFPSLRIEELTRGDIQIYVEQKLTESAYWEGFKKFRAETAAILVNEIVEKASGVFLWVFLVVRSLLAGLRDGDPAASLVDRLHELPPELEGLFSKMLDCLEPTHLKQASELFQLVEEARLQPPSLLTLFYAVEGYDKARIALTSPIEEAERMYIHEEMRRRLQSRCRGLLECPQADSHVPGNNISAVREPSKLTGTVQYLHRTVRDFIRNPVIWERILSQAPDFDAIQSLYGSYLMQVKIARRGPVDLTLGVEFWNSFKNCAEYTELWEKQHGGFPTEVIDELEIAGDAYWSSPSPDSDTGKTLLQEMYTVAPLMHEKTAWEWIRGSSPEPHWVNTWSVSHDPYTGVCRTLVKFDCFLEFCVGFRLNTYVMTKIWGEDSRQSSLHMAQSLLMPAVRNRNTDLALLLLDHGADPNLRSSDNSKSPWQEFFDDMSNLHNKMDAYNLFSLFLDHDADISSISNGEPIFTLVTWNFGQLGLAMMHAIERKILITGQKQASSQRTNGKKKSKFRVILEEILNRE